MAVGQVIAFTFKSQIFLVRINTPGLIILVVSSSLTYQIFGFHYKAYARSIKEKNLIMVSIMSDHADRMLI